MSAQETFQVPSGKLIRFHGYTNAAYRQKIRVDAEAAENWHINFYGQGENPTPGQGLGRKMSVDPSLTPHGDSVEYTTPHDETFTVEIWNDGGTNADYTSDQGWRDTRVVMEFDRPGYVQIYSEDATDSDDNDAILVAEWDP